MPQALAASLRSHSHCPDNVPRLGHLFTTLVKNLKVQLNRLLHAASGFVEGCTNAHAAGKVWDNRAPVRLALFKENCEPSGTGFPLGTPFKVITGQAMRE